MVSNIKTIIMSFEIISVSQTYLDAREQRLSKIQYQY